MKRNKNRGSYVRRAEAVFYAVPVAQGEGRTVRVFYAVPVGEGKGEG